MIRHLYCAQIATVIWTRAILDHSATDIQDKNPDVDTILEDIKIPASTTKEAKKRIKRLAVPLGGIAEQPGSRRSPPLNAMRFSRFQAEPDRQSISRTHTEIRRSAFLPAWDSQKDSRPTAGRNPKRNRNLYADVTQPRNYCSAQDSVREVDQPARDNGSRLGIWELQDVEEVFKNAMAKPGQFRVWHHFADRLERGSLQFLLLDAERPQPNITFLRSTVPNRNEAPAWLAIITC